MYLGAFVDWKPLSADRMKAEQSKGPSGGSAVSPGTHAPLQLIFSDQICTVNDYLLDFKTRFCRYQDSASGEELATDDEAISVEADIDEGGTRKALPQEARGDAIGAHAHAASQDPDSRQTIQEMEASKRDKRHHHHYRYRYVIRAQLLELLLLSCVGVQNAILHNMHVFKGNIFVCS